MEVGSRIYFSKQTKKYEACFWHFLWIEATFRSSQYLSNHKTMETWIQKFKFSSLFIFCYDFLETEKCTTFLMLVICHSTRTNFSLLPDMTPFCQLFEFTHDFEMAPISPILWIFGPKLAQWLVRTFYLLIWVSFLETPTSG